jgi:diguanylate cyclase (GGDEF)-like protein/PAS domain S-box-containing protein
MRREVQECFRVTFEQSPIGMALVGLDGRCLEANLTLVQLLRRPKSAVLASRFQELIHPDDLPDTEAQTRRLVRGEADSFQIEQRYLRPDGEPVWVRVVVSLVRDSHGRPDYFIAQVVDLSPRGGTEAELLHQAFRDPLTGLANRRLLLQRLEDSLDRATRTGRRVAVLCFDLDHFRQVNARLGPSGGDQLLVSVADILRKASRPGDTVSRIGMVSRIGGDEFVVVCEDVTRVSEAHAIADRMLRRLRALPATGATASVGIALGTAGSDPNSLLSRADAALLAAKRHGRDRIQIDDSPRP